MRWRITVAVGAFALAAWPTLAMSADHRGGGGGSSHGSGGGGHASGGGGHYGGRSSGGWHSSGGGHVGGWGHAVPRGSYGRGYSGRAYGYGRGYGSGYRGRGDYEYGYGYGRRFGYGYGRGFRYGYGGGPFWGLDFDLGWPYYGADYYGVAPYYYGNPYPDGSYIGNGDAYYPTPGRNSGDDDAYYGSPGDYSGRGGPNSQPQSGGGMLRMAVRPPDAAIYLDGRFWGSGHDVSTLRLPEGRHRVEVMRPGFRTYTHDFEVNADRPVQLSITLERP
jgi:hypothetical protein